MIVAMVFCLVSAFDQAKIIMVTTLA